jgi:capsular polysaccharide biosynthesis protein
VRPPPNAPRVRDYLNLLRRGWIVILCATALSAGAGWVAWMTTEPVYDSTARVFATTPGGATPLDAYHGHLSSVSRTITFQQLARSPQVTMRTIEQLDLDDRPSQLASRILVKVKDSAMIDVVVTGRDADLTQATANAVAENLVALSRQMSQVDTGSAELILVDAADPSVRRGSMWQVILPGGLLGLAISSVFVLGYGLVRDKLVGKGHIHHVVDEAIAGKG